MNDIKPQLMAFLQERGLALSEEKTHVTHINDGFDFLGFNARKYKGKLLIKPSKSNVLSFLRNMRDLIRKHVTIPVADLIKMMNPKLRGWANYYRHCVAKQTFGYVGHQMFLALWRWSVRRHLSDKSELVATEPDNGTFTCCDIDDQSFKGRNSIERVFCIYCSFYKEWQTLFYKDFSLQSMWFTNLAISVKNN